MGILKWILRQDTIASVCVRQGPLRWVVLLVSLFRIDARVWSRDMVWGCWMGYDSARSALCYSLLSMPFLWRKKQTIHASISTPLRFQYWVIYRMCGKMIISHQNSCGKTLQTQKSAALNSNCLVAILKPFHSHKEPKTKRASKKPNIPVDKPS